MTKSVQQERPRPGHAVAQQQGATPEEELARAQGRAPMGTWRGWALDGFILGAATGLGMVLTPIWEAQPLAGPVTFGMPAFMGVLGMAAGLGAGAGLKMLRGRVPALVGVLLAAYLGNCSASSIVLAQPEGFNPLADLIRGRAGPVALALTVLLPVVVVLRWRQRSTLPWVIAAGVLAGCMIGLPPGG